MLKAVRGVYEGGVVHPVEPLAVSGRHEVIITFVDGGGQGAKELFVAAAGSWADLDTEALKRRLYEQRSMSRRPQPSL